MPITLKNISSLILLFVGLASFAQEPFSYAELKYWAAHPGKMDPSDIQPGFLRGEKHDTLADVFFIHPTTFIRDPENAEWNADINDRRVNERTDDLPIMYQASVFNASCKVYAPRYRQAHLKSFFLLQNAGARRSFDIAYADVKRAFEFYLATYNKGRPIIIASHSQGTYHAIRLLKEFFDDKPLSRQLVCAYIVGFQVKKNEFKKLPLLTEPGATGGYVTWRSFKWGEHPAIVRRENGNASCINPVTWRSSSDTTQKQTHQGAIGRNPNKLHAKLLETTIDTLQQILWVKIPSTLSSELNLRTDYHNADYNLFYMDIRRNVELRVKKFLNR